jgi:hypothetical protein
MTMLAGVAVVLVILLAPYLRPWLAQRSDIAAKQAQVEALQRQVDDLRAERNRWNDPAFIKAQARDRLNFVMPGELGYVVLGDTRQQQADPATQAALDAGRITGRSWYDVLWQSVQLAGGDASVSSPGSPGSPSSPGSPGSDRPSAPTPSRTP